MKKAILNGCYDFNDEVILIEMTINKPAKKVNLNKFVVPSTTFEKNDWQCPYMEQYLSLDGIKKACDTYEIPNNKEKSTRIAFFIYKTKDTILKTQFGKFDISILKPLPERLKAIIDFEEID